jgi:hypothetical protein
LVVVALVTIALARGPVTLDPDSPEGTVQEYLLALSEERWDDAVEVLHDDWRGSCDGASIESFSQGEFTAELGSPGGFGGFGVNQSFVEIGEDEVGAVSPTIPDDTTQVEVTINHREQGGLGSEWQEYVVFEMVDDGEFWWIVGDPWPYFIWNCR